MTLERPQGKLSRTIAVLGAALTLGALAPAQAQTSIAVMPFDYSARTRTKSKLVRQGVGNRTWVLTTETDMVVELETDRFTNKLITALTKAYKFNVVERQKLDRLFEEQKLGTAGLADPLTAAKVGKLLGADYFVMAEIAAFDASSSAKFFEALGFYNIKRRLTLILDVRVVDTTTGKIAYAETVDASRDYPLDRVKSPNPGRLTAGDIDSVERDLCDKIVSGIVNTVFPIKVVRHTKGVVYLNRGSNGGVTVGAVYKAVEQGEAIVDEDSGLTLGAEETDVAVIEVTECQEKFSKAKLVQWIVESPTGEIKAGAICRPFDGVIRRAPPPPPADTTPPSPRILAPGNGALLNSNPVAVLVECLDPDLATLTINGSPASPGKSGWTASINATEGANTISVIATDRAGNAAQVNSTFTLDSTAPTISIVEPSAGAVINVNPAVVIVESPDPDVVRVTVNGVVATRDGGRFRAQVSCREGLNELKAIAFDGAGNQGFASSTLTVDTTPPAISILSPRADQTVNVNPVNVWVEAPDAASVTINGIPAERQPKGRFSAKISAKEGRNSIEAIAFDAAGNRGRAATSYNFDSTPPEVSGDAEVLVKGKVDDPRSAVTVNGIPVKVNADGSYEVRVKLNAEREVVIIATDEFGNQKKVIKKY